MYYNKCPRCGCNLDPCEKCDCNEVSIRLEEKYRELVTAEESGQYRMEIEDERIKCCC